MKTCSAPIFVFRWKPETGKAPGKQRKTRSFPQKRAQINRPWGDPSAKCGKLFCFFVSGRHFLGRTGLQSAVFPLHPVLFQVEGNSKKEQFCADVCPASREESPESEIIFQQGKSALRLNGAAQAQSRPAPSSFWTWPSSREKQSAWRAEMKAGLPLYPQTASTL